MNILSKAIVGGIALLSAAAFAQADVGSTFRDYAPIRTPVSTLPLGAVWIPGVGPTGPHADPSNIRISKGAASSVVTDSLKREVGVSLGTFLGLGADKAKSLRVELSNIEVHRIKDLTSLQADVGQQVVIAGVKAGTIKILGDISSAATLKASATAKGIPVTGNAASGSTATLSLDGSNLFLAFQVVSFKLDGAPKVKRYSHRGQKFAIDKIYQFDFCECGPGDAIKVYIRNLAAPSVSGTYPTETVESKNSPTFWKEVPLPRYLRGNKLTAATAKIAYFDNQSCSPISPDNQLCIASYPSEKNYVELTTTTMKIESVKKPTGTF